MAHGPKLFQFADLFSRFLFGHALELLDLLRPVAHLALELLDGRGLRGAGVLKRCGASLGLGAGGGDLVACSLDLGVQLV